MLDPEGAWSLPLVTAQSYDADALFCAAASAGQQAGPLPSDCEAGAFATADKYKPARFLAPHALSLNTTLLTPTFSHSYPLTPSNLLSTTYSHISIFSPFCL